MAVTMLLLVQVVPLVKANAMGTASGLGENAHHLQLSSTLLTTQYLAIKTGPQVILNQVGHLHASHFN